MAAIDLVELARTNSWQWRVEYYLVESAVAVMAEDEQTSNHAERVIFAAQVLDGGAQLYVYTMAVLTNASIAADPGAASDSDIQFAVQSLFTAFSL